MYFLNGILKWICGLGYLNNRTERLKYILEPETCFSKILQQIILFMLYTSEGERLSWFASKHHRVRGHQMTPDSVCALVMGATAAFRVFLPYPTSPLYHPEHTEVQQFEVAALSYLALLLISLSSD